MHSHFMSKAAKCFLLSSAATLVLAGYAAAADDTIAIGVGSTTGSSLRMRADASTSSEIITTLDEGVAVAILDDTTEGWFQISYNGKSGFVSADYMIVDQDNVFEATGRVNADGVNIRSGASTDSEVLAAVDQNTIVTVNGFSDGWYNVTCKYGTKGFIRSDFLDLTSNNTSKASALVNEAKKYLGTRYVYGGASPSGFDCSGFTMYLYKQLGISLPHTATGQWQSGVGTKVYSISALTPGDLVFFNDPSRSKGKACSHAGMYIGDGQFIHASSARSGGVRINGLYDGYYNTYFVGGIHV